jgi:hypothetical protein
MTTKTFTLEFAETPKSLNTTGARGGPGGVPWGYIAEKRKWEGNFQIRLMTEKVPRKLTSVRASAALTFPSRRRRDEGNYRFMLEKALGDTLVSGGWLEDDTPDAFVFEGVRFAEPGPALTVVTLEVSQ